MFLFHKFGVFYTQKKSYRILFLLLGTILIIIPVFNLFIEYKCNRNFSKIVFLTSGYLIILNQYELFIKAYVIERIMIVFKRKFEKKNDEKFYQ